MAILLALSRSVGYIWMNACWAAPSIGVFVAAPENKPIISGIGIPESQWRPTVKAVPVSARARDKAFSLMPPFLKAEKNPGPTCTPSEYMKMMSPKF